MITIQYQNLLSAEKNSELRDHWFMLLNHFYEKSKKNSGLECAERCSARCCPKVKSERNCAEAIGHVAIMLPFEREHILAKTTIKPEQLHSTRIDFVNGTHIDIGYITSSRPCPFLSENNHCQIYDIRPLDCRSFPLIPVFQCDGTLTFRMDTECPSVDTFSLSYKHDFQELWHELLPHLPMNYRLLFNAL